MKKIFILTFCAIIMSSACACSTTGDSGSTQQSVPITTITDADITSSVEQNSSISKDSIASESTTH